MKAFFEKINWIKVCQICNRISLPLQFLGVCLLYFVIEMMCRHSFGETLAYLTGNPIVFLYNATLIFVTTLFVYFTKRRVFWRSIIMIVWFILGAINGLVLGYRVTPFVGADLTMLTESFKVLNKYLSVLQIVGVATLIIGCVIGLVWLFRKAPKYPGEILYKQGIIVLGVAVIIFMAFTGVALKEKWISNYFYNIAYAYEDYGFPYGLSITLLDTGIECPNGYSEESVKRVKTEIEEGPKSAVKDAPNIVFLQLESFFDPTLVSFLKTSQDPIPNFRAMREKYSSGYFEVPSIGAGTANTEFETITGMSLRYFGPGEYPYKAILEETTCESAPYALKNLGYSSHAIHNNEANFYSRRVVFQNLGFDTFTSEEYMPNISDVTATGWVKDHILTDEIMKSLKSTAGRDYVYTVSVQGHGDYPTEQVIDEPVIKVSGAQGRERNNYSWEYYINQLYEMDMLIKNTTEQLTKYGEPTVLVIFGDHLPTMGLTEAEVENHNLFRTEYVVWDNIGLEKTNRNLMAYQLSATVMDYLGIHEGNVFRYHQNKEGKPHYQSGLETLQYDILYGEKHLYNGVTPYQVSELQLGSEKIIFEDIVSLAGKTWYIEGANFTASSRLEIDGEVEKDTIFISPQLLMVQGIELNGAEELAVVQQSNSSTKRVLSRTDIRIYRPQNYGKS